jgi:hypothetical protein
MGDHLRELEKKYADRLEPMTPSDKTAEVVIK